MRMPGRMGMAIMVATAAAGDLDGTAKRASDGWPVNRTERADCPLFFYASGNGTEQKKENVCRGLSQTGGCSGSCCVRS